MPLDPYLAKALLDWTTGAAAATQPSARFFGVATGVPNASNDSAGPVYRATISAFVAANSPAGSCSISGALSGNQITVAGTVTATGWNIYNSTSGGQRLIYGTLSQTAKQVSGSFFNIAIGALKLVIS